ncbi:MAG: GxxExxY protein [Prevotella sp.]|nr:GxxExxY protein [Prevotella sp.]
MTDIEVKNLEMMLFSKIVGCAFKSYNYFHWGVDELVYEAGLKAELEEIGFTVLRQQEFPIYYKGKPTEVSRRMDLVVRDRVLGNVIVELKALDYVGDVQRRQLWSYMKLLNNRYGMLINFGPKGVYSENWKLGETIESHCVRI